MTLEEQIKEVEREIALRKRVYPRLTSRGSLHQEKAERQIKTMEAVRETLAAALLTRQRPDV